MNSAHEYYSNSAQHRALSRVCLVHSMRIMSDVAHQRRFIVARLVHPNPSPATTWKLCHDTRPSISCHGREFSIAIENFEKSFMIEKSLSRQKTIRSLLRQRILCRDPNHPVPALSPVVTIKFCLDTGPRVSVASVF